MHVPSISALWRPLVWMILLPLLVPAQTPSPEPAKRQPPSLTRDLQPIFRRHCYDCHAAAVKMGSLDLETYKGIMTGGNQGTIVTPGDGANSRLHLIVSGKLKPMMPMDGSSLKPAEIALIREWIDAGARDDAPSATDKHRQR